MVTNASIGTPRAGDSVATLPMMDFKVGSPADVTLASQEAARPALTPKKSSRFRSIRAHRKSVNAAEAKSAPESAPGVKLGRARFSLAKSGLAKPEPSPKPRSQSARFARLRVSGIGISAIRTTPESVKRPLRIALVRVVRTVVAMPGGRRMVLSVQRQMPETSSWLLRRYVAYRQMSIDHDMDSCKASIGVLDDFSRDEALYLRRIETALRAKKEL